MIKKTWSDQPDEVEVADQLLGSFVVADLVDRGKGAVAEVRSAPTLDSIGPGYGNRPRTWFLTILHSDGWSETLKCKDAQTVLKALCQAGGPIPDGAELMENAK